MDNPDNTDTSKESTRVPIASLCHPEPSKVKRPKTDDEKQIDKLIKRWQGSFTAIKTSHEKTKWTHKAKQHVMREKFLLPNDTWEERSLPSPDASSQKKIDSSPSPGRGI